MLIRGLHVRMLAVWSGANLALCFTCVSWGLPISDGLISRPGLMNSYWVRSRIFSRGVEQRWRQFERRHGRFPRRRGVNDAGDRSNIERGLVRVDARDPPKSGRRGTDQNGFRQRGGNSIDGRSPDAIRQEATGILESSVSVLGF